MAWEVLIAAIVHKKLKRLPTGIEEIFQLLLAEMKLSGPVQVRWPHYGKLRNAIIATSREAGPLMWQSGEY